MSTQQEQLYLKTIDTLKNRISSHDPFNILSASANIWELFLDNQPLVDLANEQFKTNFTFDVCLPVPDTTGRPEPVEPVDFSLQEGLDPETAMSSNCASRLVRDKFLRIVLTTINGRKYTIKDLVEIGVTIMGDVNSGSEISEKEKVLKSVSDQMSTGGYAPFLRQLQAIGRVTLKSLAPLTLHIQNKSE